MDSDKVRELSLKYTEKIINDESVGGNLGNTSLVVIGMCHLIYKTILSHKEIPEEECEETAQKWVTSLIESLEDLSEIKKLK